MRFLKLIAVVLLLIFFFAPDPMLFSNLRRSEKSAEDEALYDECDKHCGPMTGEAKVRCVRACISARRKNEPIDRQPDRAKRAECDSICNEYSGLDNVRCLRLCRDGKNMERTDNKKTPSLAEQCRQRCGRLSGAEMTKCLRECIEKK